MSIALEQVSRPPWLALRYALRELRGGLRGFYVFIACIALGVMAIAGVGSVAASLSDGLAREGRTLLGGDAAFSLIQREAEPEELAFLRSRGTVSVAATLRAMARTLDGKLALVELKAVDGAYPMLGQLTLEPNMPMRDLLAERDGAFGAAADAALLARLDLKIGDRVSIGSAAFQIRSVVEAEPDKLAGGVGVANAVKSHIDRRRDVIATFKAVGATGRDVFTIYLTQVIVLALAGSVVGLIAGAALPYVVVGLFGAVLPLPVVPALHPAQLLLSLLYGLLTALAFALWPLGRVHDVPVAALFREAVTSEWHRPRWRYLVLMAVVIALLAAIAIGLAYDKRVAAVFVVASAVVFALLRGIAAALMALTRRLPRSRITMLRLAVANISRPGALTPSVVMSLGLGLAVLVTITQIDGNLRRQFLAALPDRAPSFYFIDIPAAEADRFGAFLKAQAPDSTVEDVPMLRGRIVAARGVKAEDLKPSHDAEWVLQSDRGLTYTSEIPKGSKVVEGKWWGPDYNGPPLVSFEKKIADGLGLKIGDEIVVNVLGRDISATIGNMRTVDWQSLGINFVLVFSPNAFRGAPHTHIATLTEPHPGPAGDARIIRSVADTFPSVTSVRVREALETIGTVVTNLVLAIRGASAVTLISAILVLGGALAAGHRHRVYDAVILKTLGATRIRLLGAYALEYLMIGLATAVFGVLAGSVAAWLIVTRLMTLSFVWQAGSALGVVD